MFRIVISCALLAIIALSAVQSSIMTLIHDAILSTDTSTMPDTINLIPYLVINASNVIETLFLFE